MQTFRFKKAAPTLIIVTLLASCFCCLQKAGVQPFAVAFFLIFLRGILHFIFHMTVILLPIAITGYLFITLLTCV
jgi:uncharacterized membrane protein YjjP (DUF1212 family)